MVVLIDTEAREGPMHCYAQGTVAANKTFKANMPLPQRAHALLHALTDGPSRPQCQTMSAFQVAGLALLIAFAGGGFVGFLIFGWWPLSFLALLTPFIALLHVEDVLPGTANETDDSLSMRWEEALLPEAATRSQRQWLFWSFLVCMAMAALPLMFIRWTSPKGTLMAGAIEGVALFAAPFVIALPFLLLGCIGSLAFSPSTRNRTSTTTLALSGAIVIASVHAVLTG